jgi:hypothetical protein
MPLHHVKSHYNLILYYTSTYVERVGVSQHDNTIAAVRKGTWKGPQLSQKSTIREIDIICACSDHGQSRYQIWIKCDKILYYTSTYVERVGVSQHDNTCSFIDTCIYRGQKRGLRLRIETCISRFVSVKRLLLIFNIFSESQHIWMCRPFHILCTKFGSDPSRNVQSRMCNIFSIGLYIERTNQSC